jgi:5-methylcytosine-specific restriction protein A
MLHAIIERVRGKVPLFKRRSPHWKGVRSKYLRANPTCSACDGVDRLEVHHIIPFHVFPELELDETNLITLCESRDSNCHLRVGHLGSWRKWNADVRADALVEFIKRT